MHDTNHSDCHTEHKKYFFLMVVEKSNYFTGIDSSLVTNYTDVHAVQFIRNTVF